MTRPVLPGRAILAARSNGPPRFFVGTNGCGIAFALDKRGRVLAVDEITMDEAVLAPSFAAVIGERAVRARAKFPWPDRMAEVLRRFGNKSFRRLDPAVLGKRLPKGFSGRIKVIGAGVTAAYNATWNRRLPAARRKAIFFFAKDGGGNLLAVDRDAQVVIVDPDGNERRLAPFSKLVDALTAGSASSSRQ